MPLCAGRIRASSPRSEAVKLQLGKDYNLVAYKENVEVGNAQCIQPAGRNPPYGDRGARHTLFLLIGMPYGQWDEI